MPWCQVPLYLSACYGSSVIISNSGKCNALKYTLKALQLLTETCTEDDTAHTLIAMHARFMLEPWHGWCCIIACPRLVQGEEIVDQRRQHRHVDLYLLPALRQTKPPWYSPWGSSMDQDCWYNQIMVIIQECRGHVWLSVTSWLPGAY
jgi:hypothetical protein